MIDEKFYWLALNFVPGIGSVLFRRLIDRFRDPEAVFRATEKELLNVEGVSKNLIIEIKKGPSEKRVRKELTLVNEIGGKLLTIRDELYPNRLREIYDPPPLLYLRGDLKREDELAVAVVGSRKTTPYGRWMAEKISQDLSQHGITIVSGMARGIDSVAHLGALSSGGRTIAVLGCGVDVIYPSENRALSKKIIEQGALLSEFPMGTPPESSHFPRRNRIISGLALGVVIVQAGERSGALITAGYALEQGREVFAVPGNVGAETSRGANRLIREGAKMVESSEDILEEILPQWKKEKEVETGEPKIFFNLSVDEKKLYSLLGTDPLHIDTLIRESQFEPGQVSSLLLNLEMKGLITQWPGKYFSKKT
ncbi:MAG: DNA-processing protein DprA [Thermodesulfobacteriota bacterium]